MEPPPDPAPSALPARPMMGGAVMATAGRAVVAVTGALTTIFVARHLGPEGAGAFAIALTVVFMLQTATTFGLEHGIAFYVSAGEWAPRAAARVAIRVALASGVAGACAGIGLRLLVPEAFGGLELWATVVTAASLPFALLWFHLSFIALAADRYEAYVLPPAVYSTLALALVAGLALAFDLDGAIVGLAAAQVVVGLGSLWWTRRLPRDDAPPAPGMLRRAMSFGAKGYGANALQFLNLRLDLFVLSVSGTAAAVGQLSVALAVTSALWLVPQALSEVLFPRVAALTAGGEGAAHDLRAVVERKSLRHTVLLVTGTAAAIAAALLLLVQPVYGSDFEPAVELGLILLPGVALMGLGNVLAASIVGRGRPDISLRIALVVTPLTVVGYVVLVPELGAEGAALAKTLSYTANFALAAFFFRRLTGAGGLRDYVPGRAELTDLLVLPRAIRAWAAQLRT